MLFQAKLLLLAGLNLVCDTLLVTGSKQTISAKEKQI